MRELHDWHERGDHGRHARDAHAPADGHAARAPEGPRHAAHNSPKLRMLLDPAARIAEQLRYGETVAGYSPKHAADQRKPADRDVDQGVRQAQGSDRPRTSVTENRTPPEGRERRTPDRETRDALAEVDQRTARLPEQSAKKQRPERSWLPRADTFKMLGGNSLALATIAVAAHLIPDTWERVGVTVVAAIAGNVTWANKRWKEKHGNRSEGRADDQDDARPRDTA